MTDDLIVIADDLQKSYGETRALVGLDLEVRRGSVLGVLGPNGAGKTTAVRILTTLIEPDAGRAVIDGIDVLAEPRRVRSRIGLTGQYAAVDERLSARENLELVGRFHRFPGRQAKARASDLLERFDLVEAADRVVSGFSGGMRRRLDISMSLVAEPVVLFLDEPTTGLDPRSRLAMWELIEELTDEGMTTLLTTQYLEEADHLAHEIVVIDHGRVIARGTADELKDTVGGSRAEIVLPLGSSVALADVLSALGHRVNVALGPVADGNRLAVPVRPGTTAPSIVHALDAAGIGIEDVSVERPTLDDVFMSLTGHSADDEEEEQR